MNFYKTTAAFGVTACMLLATSAYGDGEATLPAKDTFESGTGAWTVNDATPTVTELGATIQAPTPAGFPTSESTSSKVLAISGSGKCEYTGATSNPFVDMMVKVSIPDSALAALATGEDGEAAGAQFAVAVDTDGVFKYWNSSLSTPAWVALSSTTYSADAWVRVTMKFDYPKGECTVALNGNTCGTYHLIATASALASVEVKGETAIDEVVVAQNATPAFSDASAVVTNGCLATKAWLTKNDVAWPASLTEGQSAALSSQYAFGLAPDTTATAAATLPLSFEQDTTSNKAKLSFPGYGAYGGTGSYVLQTSTDKSTWSATAAECTNNDGVNTTTVDLPATAGTAVYYRIVAQPAQQSSGS